MTREDVIEQVRTRVRAKQLDTYEELMGGKKVDMVNNPPHYNQGSVECIDAIESALGAEGFRAYCKGNAIKYIWREAHKGGNESLEKAVWYLHKALDGADVQV